MNLKWRDAVFVSFDVETSGQYPLSAEICEIAAVKWQNGQIIDQFQSLAATKNRMSDTVIAIHHITNEMLVGAPPLPEVIQKFHTFIDNHNLIAHHAPFDLGFIAPEFERGRLPLPTPKAFCSSLLSRKAFPESTNHKLQTLIKFFNLEQGQAHRALDDARACLEVGLRVFAKIGADATLEEILAYQEASLPWSAYGIESLRAHHVYNVLILALQNHELVQIVYSGGSKPGEARTVKPIGLVRNPLDDYFLASEREGEIPKRYFLKKINAARF